MPNYTQQQAKNTSCNWHNCCEPAEYAAPKTRDKTSDYHWFCLNHIREYNKSWDYFDGMNEAEIEDFQIDSIHGHRKTRKIGLDPSNVAQKIVEELEYMFGPPSPALKSIPPEIKQALAALNLSYPISFDEIKAQYKLLVKKHHPDMNNGDKTAEEIFKQISTAYKTLEQSGFFN